MDFFETETERLLIRRYRPTDEADLCEFMLQRVNEKFEQYADFSTEKAKEELAFRMESKEFYAIEEKKENKVIGNLYFGFREFDQRELGYVLNQNYQHQGFGTEACNCFIKNAFRQGVRRVFAETCPENVASWKLMEKIGMKREAHLRQNISFHKDQYGHPVYWDTYVYGLLFCDL